ncbi:MAG: TetR/AcrR family transcriptional regulator [Bacillota bacterium]|nr:TetR/AcrR family transcriptional regulator [Bacillota bacterium]
MPVDINFENKRAGKKELILLAAIDMFLEKDYYQVTIVEIAGRAGVGKGTVYEYYSSKEDLFRECFSYCTEAYLKSFNEHLSRTSTVRKTMRDIIVTHIEMLSENRKGLHLLYKGRPYNFHELQNWVIEQRQSLLTGIAELIEEGIRLKEIRPDVDAKMAGRLFLALNYIVLGGIIVIDEDEVRQDQIDSLLDILWNGIGINKLHNYGD